jgi:hypothetical protein
MTNNEYAARLDRIATNHLLTQAECTMSNLASLRAGAAALLAVDKAKAALRGLVKALGEVHEDPYYHRVWSVHQLHCGPYKGTQYEAELKRAAAVLAELEKTDAPV